MKKVLIANRGEIAVRIIRACHQLGLKAVAVYSEADAESLHVQLADEAYCIGGAAPKESYLHMDSIMTAIKMSRADALHPGFGMLSEDPALPKSLEEASVTFIGPPSDVMRLMGDKAKARETARAAGVPVVPGSNGVVGSVETALFRAQHIGYPLLVKAVMGGGGRGIRLVNNDEELKKQFPLARAEAESAFGDGRVYLERFITSPRHVEVQILADNHGHVLHLGTRDCTLQRRKQKVVEEAPAASIPKQIRDRMCQYAVNLARKAKYRNAGTIEFLVDQNDKVYFIEMNTRVQVEHTITEMITGIDIVASQLRLAMGEPLMARQEDILIEGHSIECRINAEDPMNGFAPSPGKIESFQIPGGLGIRVDSLLYPDCTISARYDSMIMKLIAYGDNRTVAIQRMKQALSELQINGIHTNIGLHQAIMEDTAYHSGVYDTNYLENTLIPGMNAPKD